jgi:hypothetical protein
LAAPPLADQPKTITGETFAGVVVSHALKDEFSIVVGDDPWIGCTPYIDQQHWSSDFNDKLYLSKFGPATWTHLQVKKADVLREIKFDVVEEKRQRIYTSGAPGRPTSMNLVKLEFEARYRTGDTAPSITLEAAALAEWLSRTHPEATPVKPKTIKNQLASEFRKRNAQKSKNKDVGRILGALSGAAATAILLSPPRSART